MVVIKLLYKKQKINGFQIKGHANFDKKGQDIVCAAVSVLSQTALIGLRYFLNEEKYNFTIKDGYIDCSLKNGLSEEEDKTAQVILQTMYLGLKSIQESYERHVKIIEEVHWYAKNRSTIICPKKGCW